MCEVRQMAIAALMALVTVGLVLVVSPVVDGGEGFARENAIIVIAGVCLFNSLYVALRIDDIGAVDPLFMWFMAVVVGSLLTIQWQLHGIAKSLNDDGRRQK